MDARHYDHRRLKTFRLRAGLTQSQVAADLGFHRSTLHRAETGEIASYNLLARLAAYYGQEVTVLLYPIPRPVRLT